MAPRTIVSASKLFYLMLIISCGAAFAPRKWNQRKIKRIITTGDSSSNRRYPFIQLLLSTSNTQQSPPTQSNWTTPSTTDIADIANNLDGRLLCATQCAYNTTEPYSQSAGYIPQTIGKRISRTINSVFIGRTIDGIVVSFRGTKPNSPLDWIQNAGIYLNSFPSIPGKIHSGFYGAVKSLWKPLVREVKNMMLQSDNDDEKLYFTGHSKGGAMASIAAVLFQLEEDLPNVTYVCTFASVKFGNSEFRDEYNKMINQTTYESFLDIIPFLPPSASTMESMSDDMKEMVDGMLWSSEYTSTSTKQNYIWDYQSVGKRRYINETYQIDANVTKELDDFRIKNIEEKTLLQFRKFVAAHCSSCPNDENGCDGSYFRGVASEVCAKN